MKLLTMTNSWEGSNKFGSIMLISNVILSCVLAVSLYGNATTHEITRLVPPYLDKAVALGWNTADQSYLESVGLYVATLAGNVTPKSAKFVADRLSEILTPRIYQSAREQILALANDPAFANAGGSVRFDATKIVSEKETQKVFVIGQMTSQQIGSKDVKAMVIEMKIFMKDGRPWVDSLDHYDGSDPHTLGWMDKNPSKEQQIEKQQAAAASSSAQTAEGTAQTATEKTQ